jgi:hypothetical protein
MKINNVGVSIEKMQVEDLMVFHKKYEYWLSNEKNVYTIDATRDIELVTQDVLLFLAYEEKKIIEEQVHILSYTQKGVDGKRINLLEELNEICYKYCTGGWNEVEKKAETSLNFLSNIYKKKNFVVHNNRRKPLQYKTFTENYENFKSFPSTFGLSTEEKMNIICIDDDDDCNEENNTIQKY